MNKEMSLDFETGGGKSLVFCVSVVLTIVFLLSIPSWKTLLPPVASMVKCRMTRFLASFEDLARNNMKSVKLLYVALNGGQSDRTYRT